LSWIYAADGAFHTQRSVSSFIVDFRLRFLVIGHSILSD
jgi:hypothetical protein